MVLTEQTIIAIIGLGAVILGALVTALLQPLWTNVISPKYRLHISVTPHRNKIPKFLYDGIWDYRYNHLLNIKPTEETKEKLSEITRYNGHFDIRISNKSKRAISNIVLTIGEGEIFLADINGSDLATHCGKALNLGSLHPESEIHVHVWASSDLSSSAWKDAREYIKVRAESYDKISMALENAGYITGRYFLFPKKIFNRVAVVLWIIIVGLGAFSSVISVGTMN